jgi:dTMP kinase
MLEFIPMNADQRKRQTRSALSPTESGLARVPHDLAQVGHARLAAEQGGEGGSDLGEPVLGPPTPPHKGEGSVRGRFITFEGGEGSGKSTHARLLSDRLKTLGIDVVLTREPGGSPGAEAIRHVLMSGAAKPLGAEAEALLFAAARDDHVRNTIEPALARGAWVISDRFLDSTRVYQGTLGHVDPKFIRALERVTVGDLKPDLTFILDVPADVGLARASKRRGETAADRFEAESLAIHQELREAYRLLVVSEPARCIIIDVTEPKPAVADRIWKTVIERLSPATAPAVLTGVAS